MVVYGHTPVPEPEWLNRTINIDTGCVFGGKLTALRYPERELVSVPAARDLLRAGPPVPARRAQAPGAHGAAGARRRARRRGRARQADRHDPAARQRHDPRGERRRGARGDEPVRRRPEVADLPAADDVAVRDERASRACWSIRPRRSPTTAARGAARSSARRSTWARGPWSSSAATRTAARERFGVVDGEAGICLHPHRPALLRRRRRWSASSSTRCAAALDRSGLLGRARDRLGLPRLRADAVVGQGAGTAARSSTPRSAPRRASALAADASRALEQADGARRRRSARCSSGHRARRGAGRAVRATPTGTTAGRSSRCATSSSRRSTCWRPRARSTPTRTTSGTWTRSRGFVAADDGAAVAHAATSVVDLDRPGERGGGDRAGGRS